MLLIKELWFFALRSGHQDASFEVSKKLFEIKGGPFFYFWGSRQVSLDLLHPTNETNTTCEIHRQKALQKQSAQISSSNFGFLASTSVTQNYLDQGIAKRRKVKECNQAVCYKCPY